MYSGSQASRSSPGGMPSVSSSPMSDSTLPPIAAAPSIGCGMWRDSTRSGFRSMSCRARARSDGNSGGSDLRVAHELSREPVEDARQVLVLLGRPPLEVLAQSLPAGGHEPIEHHHPVGRQGAAPVARVADEPVRLEPLEPGRHAL